MSIVQQAVVHWAPVQRILGLLLMMFSINMLPPVVVGLIYGDGGIAAFLTGFAIVFVLGSAVWFPVRDQRRELKIRDGFTIVVMFWVVLGLFGAVPLYLSDRPYLSVTDAVFESVSGLTTTGATILVGIDTLPHSILWYRQQLHLLGGMGIIVLAVAILPLLGVGGMQLYRAETPGPMKDAKLAPRITETAKTLWLIYMGLIVVCTTAYWFAGMPMFDALSHAISTVATGGFSTHDQSIGYFDSALIESIAVVFMILGSLNFALHFFAFRGGGLKPYWHDPETRLFFFAISSVTVVCTIYLFMAGSYAGITESFMASVFQVISIGTTTGFTTAEYTLWPSFLPMLLLLGSFVGGCAGGTTGGMKVMRFVLIFKQGSREIMQLLHPSAELPVKIGTKRVPERVIKAVWGFFAAYILIFVGMLLILMGTGLSEVTAWSAVAACLNNLGPGLGEVASNMATLNDPAKWVLIAAMFLGRLEIFPLLVLLSPAFWRR